ncbi:MAG: hypothetical protein ACRD3W_01360, partial [Terriglobales bacterium]
MPSGSTTVQQQPGKGSTAERPSKEVEQLANNLDAGNQESVQKFLTTIDKWTDLPEEQRRQN